MQCEADDTLLNYGGYEKWLHKKELFYSVNLSSSPGLGGLYIIHAYHRYTGYLLCFHFLTHPTTFCGLFSTWLYPSQVIDTTRGVFHTPCSIIDLNHRKTEYRLALQNRSRCVVRP